MPLSLFSMRRSLVAATPLLVATLGLATVRPSHAGTLTEFKGGTNSLRDFPGQSVTTPTGGPFNNITFSFYSPSNPTGPNGVASGHLFILTQEYLGNPLDLSPTTAGFLAESNGVPGTSYVFDPTVTLLGNTQYFFYADQSITLAIASPTTPSNQYSGGQAYFGGNGSEPFITDPTSDYNFTLSGTAVSPSAPEPGSLALMGMGFVSLTGALVVRRRLADMVR